MTRPLTERTPKRVQLKRTKGWRKPEGAVVVSRPTKWGNPHDWQECLENADHRALWTAAERHAWAREYAIGYFREDLEGDPARIEEAKRELRGKDLCCWCPLDQPCHADVLLDIANRED